MGALRGKPSKLLLPFAGLFVLLFVGLAVAVGFGSPSIPAGAVAVIEGAPPGTETITTAELRRALERQAGLSGGEAPRPGSEEYEVAQKQALSELITVTWLAGQGEELGLQVGRSQARLSLPILQEKIMARLTREAPDPSNPQPYFTEIDFKFPGEWLPRTHCKDGFVVEQCGNYVAGHVSAPCYEAQPTEPVEGCPAPLLQRALGQPGTFTERLPSGHGLLQGPIPAGG
ncbi:MAG: hypothetical protein ACJ76D_04285 [Solirubrobacterales bacterium]